MCISAATIDYSTQANIDQVKTTHVHLDWHVDFNRKVIFGHATLDLYTLVDHVDKVILDTSYLDIKSVAVNSENAKFNVAERYASLGSALTIHLPQTIEKSEQFSNGVTIMALYLHPLSEPKDGIPIEHSIHQVIREISLLYCLPKNPLQHFFVTNKLSVQETVYGYVGWIFCQHFLNRLGQEYISLTHILDSANPLHEEVLATIKKRLRQDTFTREYILNIIRQHPDLVKLLYANFAKVHYLNRRQGRLQQTISYQRLRTIEDLTEEELRKKIKSSTSNSHEQLVFESFLTFNKHVLKTNFYQSTKVALSFRMDPSFLPEIEYPNPLYGMFFVVGSEFRGFHLRFQDVARGGIRIIRSRNREAYSINLRTLFDENYALAATQQRKNKDIPEGGSKGTILLNIDQQDKPLVAFEKYVDSILDLLIVGYGDPLVDLVGKPEILFFGPDEGTADYMDWASQHARRRHASFWKAFTTGKSQALGGIPHDLFGMTTRSVHQYVLGIYRKDGLKEEECTKVQTGGPDGDLGSNEIKISKDNTIAVVDGSGVLYDPVGIDRDELSRLAQSRLMIHHFDKNKLSPQGFCVLVDDNNVTLPNGIVVESGLQFRNTFHTNPLAQATVFVPCGGRPESVGLDNMHMLIDSGNGPLFKYVVEGANLFFTQEARIRLEKAGIKIFKDASANKGGVTSSSLEVTYSAKVTSPLPVVMSALQEGTEEVSDDLKAYLFKQPTSIPSYLIAIAVGNLVGREIGPRSTVWCEPEMVEQAAWEFSDTESFIATGESLLTPYEWGRYDLLVLPPSFPYGGMENPCLTFVTPTLLAGDKSAVAVIAHEIAHSWMGNLVTTNSWVR
ncbi:Putative NAD-specific glutamate dehydrogenase [Rhizopus microsporus]|nr:Putative NAD-specific glutamate dehydrogenase [Rhizopus microsporus]